MRLSQMKNILACFMLISLSAVPAVFAANDRTTGSIPPGQEPGAQGERLYKQFQQKKDFLSKKKVKAPEVEVEKQKKAAIPSNVTFLLKEIKITGTTVFKSRDFEPLYKGYLSKKVSFTDLDEISKRIEDQYVRAGYLTTVAFIPEQEIKGGKVILQVVEGKLGKVKIEGNRWFSSALIKRFLHIREGQPLNMPQLQKDILRLNQNPDLEVKTLIQAGETTGTSDIVLRVTEKLPYHVGSGFDNQGTRLTGKSRTSFSLRSSNLTGNLDSLYATNILSSGTVGVSSGYSIPINTRGTAIGMDMTYFRMKLGKELESYHVTGVTQIYDPHISQELYLSESFQANATAGLEFKMVNKKVAGTVTTNDQLRLPYLGFDLTKDDAFLGGGETTFSPKFIFGTSHFLGASSRNHPSASRDDTGGFFFNYQHNLRRMQKLWFQSYAAIRSSFQASPYSLPSSEQFQLGGINSVRGYPEGDYMADIGGNISTDWMFPAYFIPKTWKLPKVDTPIQRMFEPFALYDIGLGKLNKTLQGEREHKFLMGMGGGIQFHFGRNLYVRAQWAKAVGDKPVSGAGPSTFYITCQAEI